MAFYIGTVWWGIRHEFYGKYHVQAGDPTLTPSLKNVHMYEKCILQLVAKGLLIVECRLSTVGCWLSVVHCCWLLIVVCRLSGVGCWLSVVVVVDYCWLLTVVCRLSGVGCWSSVVVVVGNVWLPTCRVSAVDVACWLSGSVVDENFDCRCPALLSAHAIYAKMI